MAEEILKGQWRQLRGAAKKQWGKLTDDELDEVQGNWDQLVGKLQKEYGYSKQQAESEVSKFLDRNRQSPM